MKPYVEPNQDVLSMGPIYDSEDYIVLHISTARHSGFEVVSKNNGKSVFLHDSWAACFQKRIDGWNKVTPMQEEVEEVLELYCVLAQCPVVLH